MADGKSKSKLDETEQKLTNPDAVDSEATDDLLEEVGGDSSAVTSEANDQLAQLKQKAEERDEYLSLLQRVRADYANYQKRVQKEIGTERRYAVVPLAGDLLGILDNLERAIDATVADDSTSGLLDGIKMVHQQFLDVLARHGVQPIGAKGQPFDPNFHEAVMEDSSCDYPPGIVTNELQRGYTLHDRVVRPTKVVVSKVQAEDLTQNDLERDSDTSEQDESDCS